MMGWYPRTGGLHTNNSTLKGHLRRDEHIHVLFRPTNHTLLSAPDASVTRNVETGQARRQDTTTLLASWGEIMGGAKGKKKRIYPFILEASSVSAAMLSVMVHDCTCFYLFNEASLAPSHRTGKRNQKTPLIPSF